MEEFQTLFNHIGQELSEEDVSEWLTSDQHDRGYKHFNDDEIVASIVNENDEEEEELSIEDSQESTQISHSAAVSILTDALNGFYTRRKPLFTMLEFFVNYEI